MKRCVLIGGGGHARVVSESMNATEMLIEAIADPAASQLDWPVDGVTFATEDDDLAELRSAGITHFVVAFGAIEDMRRRREVFDLAVDSGFEPLSVLHPSAVLSPSAAVGPGTFLAPQAVVNARARVGSNCVINTSAVVEHDSVLGNDVHIAPGAIILGGARISDLVLVGASAVVLEGRSVGAGATVGAGAVVHRDVAPGVTVVGIPARQLER